MKTTNKSENVFDFSKMTYKQMAAMVRSIAVEVKKRNPIFVNCYVDSIHDCYKSLEEISDGEVFNCTSECGPKEI